jgi:hypothetical protein
LYGFTKLLTVNVKVYPAAASELSKLVTVSILVLLLKVQDRGRKGLDPVQVGVEDWIMGSKAVESQYGTVSYIEPVDGRGSTFTKVTVRVSPDSPTTLLLEDTEAVARVAAVKPDKVVVLNYCTVLPELSLRYVTKFDMGQVVEGMVKPATLTEKAVGLRPFVTDTLTTAELVPTLH